MCGIRETGSLAVPVFPQRTGGRPLRKPEAYESPRAPGVAVRPPGGCSPTAVRYQVRLRPRERLAFTLPSNFGRVPSLPAAGE